MRRGVVLPFPPLCNIGPEDASALQRLTAAFPALHVDLVAGRAYRAFALLSLHGQRVWIGRDGAGFVARDAASGRPLAGAAKLASLLTALQAVLLPGQGRAWGGMTDDLGASSARPVAAEA